MYQLAAGEEDGGNADPARPRRRPDGIKQREPPPAPTPGMKLTWDINDPKLPQEPKHFDAFQEWPDGYVRLIYSSEEKNAQRHLSGWAMRNTNNHNCQILKKSCLGVVVCARSCTLPGGARLQLRPAICDKARQKQQRKACPNCNSALELIPCRGHSGYPVTNFWRLDGKAIFFQAKGVHDHPRPESKLEAEARRSAIKKQISSFHHSQKKPLSSEAGRYHDSSSYANNLQNLPFVDSLERVGVITDSSFSVPAQSYPSVPNAELHKAPYDLASFQEDQLSPYPKCPNPRIYMPKPCSYEFGVPTFISSSPYPMFCKDLTSPATDADALSLNGSHYNAVTTHDKSFENPGRHYGLKPSWGKTGSGDRSDYGQMQASSNHPYYSRDYPCRYGPSPSTMAPPLQTVITTTTKVSYQAYKPSALKYSDNLSNMKNLQSYTHVAENISGAVYSGMKIQEDFGMIKSALLYQHDPVPTKSKPAETVETYQYGPPLGNSYAEHDRQTLRFESAEY